MIQYLVLQLFHFNIVSFHVSISTDDICGVYIAAKQMAVNNSSHILSFIYVLVLNLPKIVGI